MTAVEAMGRIGQIQSTLKQINEPAKAAETKAAAAVPAAAAAPTTATDFAAALTQAVQSSTSTAPPPVVAAPATTANPASPVKTGAVTGNDVVEQAKKYIGVPYVWGGTDPAKGMDCSGFVQRVYKDLGIDLPRVVSDQMTKGTPVASLGEAKAGDLLVSYGGNHISIYLGNGKAIDAPVPGQTIQIRDAWEAKENLMQIRRIVPEAGA
jgi:cell wall-associated NlpC family hydrolase